MIIPPARLSAATLQGLIEAFITREGTDYGADEIDLSVKVKQVEAQLAQSEVLIVFDSATESVNLVTKDQYLLLPSQSS